MTPPASQPEEAGAEARKVRRKVALAELQVPPKFGAS
jgi:hypothetical protein